LPFLSFAMMRSADSVNRVHSREAPRMRISRAGNPRVMKCIPIRSRLYCVKNSSRHPTDRSVSVSLQPFRETKSGGSSRRE
jgi:hypothetical protein